MQRVHIRHFLKINGCHGTLLMPVLGSTLSIDLNYQVKNDHDSPLITSLLSDDFNKFKIFKDIESLTYRGVYQSLINTINRLREKVHLPTMIKIRDTPLRRRPRINSLNVSTYSFPFPMAKNRSSEEKLKTN